MPVLHTTVYLLKNNNEMMCTDQVEELLKQLQDLHLQQEPIFKEIGELRGSARSLPRTDTGVQGT